MLAWLPPADLEPVLDRIKFEKVTAKTVASRRALLSTLREVRAKGVSVSDSGTVSDVLSVAAPIFDQDGRIFAAISAGGPTARMMPHLNSIQKAVKGAAEDVSAILGFTREWPVQVG